MPLTVFEAASQNKIRELERILMDDREAVNALFIESRDRSREINHVNALVAWWGKKIIGWGAVGAGAVCTGLSLFTGGVTAPFGLLLCAVGLESTGAGLALGWDDALAEYTYDRSGWTPLHFAAASDSIEAALLLIQKDAVGTIVDSKNRSFLDIANELKGNKFVAENKFMQACTAAMTTRDITKALIEARSNEAMLAAQAERVAAEERIEALNTVRAREQIEYEAVRAEIQRVRGERNECAELLAAMAGGHVLFSLEPVHHPEAAHEEIISGEIFKLSSRN